MGAVSDAGHRVIRHADLLHCSGHGVHVNISLWERDADSLLLESLFDLACTSSDSPATVMESIHIEGSIDHNLLAARESPQSFLQSKADDAATRAQGHHHGTNSYSNCSQS